MKKFEIELTPKDARILFEKRLGKKIPDYIVTTDEMMLDALLSGKDVAFGLADSIAKTITEHEQ